MGLLNNPPREFADWLDTLKGNGLGMGFQYDVAALLRVISGTRSSGVMFAAGDQSIPYVDWVQDGMAMTCRLIVHPASENVAQLVQPRFATDIRVATHHQNFAEFLADIESHRFDLILFSMDQAVASELPIVVGRLADHGLLIVLGEQKELAGLSERFGASHFCSWLGATNTCMMVARKGMQHTAVRRGGRRRHHTPA